MSGRKVAAAEFKAKCLNIIEQMVDDGESITITKRGRPVAVLSPVPEQAARASIIGSMVGSVLAYDDPFSPAVDVAEWDANR